MNSSTANSTHVPPVFYVPLALTCWWKKPFILIFSATSMTDMLLSVPSNIWVVSLLLRRKKSSLSSDIFMANLAILELIISLSTLISFSEVLDLASPFTATMTCFSGLVIAGRPLSQCCICVERYLAVVRPIIFLKYKALRYKLSCLAAVWFITVSMCLLHILEFSYIMVAASFLPVLAVDVFCSFSILRALKHPRPGDGERDEMNLMKRRAFNTVLAIQVTMVFNYLPIIIASAISPFFSNDYCQCNVLPYAFCFSYFGNFIHPLLYLLRDHRLPCMRHV